jgi:hypothetical protein
METAKEKAISLVEKFKKEISYAPLDAQRSSDPQAIKEFVDCAKQCAIIAVDELIDTLTELFNEHIHNEISETLIESKIIYYQEVKNELNQL